MSRRDELLRSAEDRDQRSTRIRDRFGLRKDARGDQVTDWLLSAGAVPAAIFAICLVVYLAVSLIAGFLGS